MTVTREKLYVEVWAEPMITVAKRYEVSGSFLARVCERLRVPRPPRGYWAKLAAGKTCKRRLLPEPQPGDELEWSREGEPRRVPPALPQPPTKRPRKRIRPRPERPSQHDLITGAREHFDAARGLDTGYLKPQKRLLVDLIVSKETLTRGLAAANDLFLTLEDRGHRVMFSPSAECFTRASVDPREQPQRTEYYPSLWFPSRRTVVYIGTVAFGLTFFEIAETVEVRWVDGKYVRVAEVDPPKRRRYATERSWVSKRDLPSGRLCLQAYSPYPGTTWQKQWRESKAGELANKLVTIVRALESEAPIIAQLVEAAARKAELEQQRWEAQRAEWQREEAERKRVQALKESREQLFSIIKDWAEAKRIEEFFQDAERRGAKLGSEQRVVLLERLQKARELVGGTDALRRFLLWKAPEER